MPTAPRAAHADSGLVRDVRANVGEEGHSLISSLFGVLLFLVLLLFAVQVTTHLYATTVVTTATFDTARLVSGSRSLATGQVAPQVAACLAPGEDELRRANDHLAGLLGALWSEGGTADWAATTSDRVAVTVSVPTPARIIGGIGVVAGLDRITRTISLARECVR